MKNILAENMLRFGTKNISEAARQELVLKSIMETINEHGLHNAVRQQLMEAASTYEGSLESLYQGVVNALNKALKAYQTANPAATKFKDKVFNWGKMGIGKPTDPNMQGVTDIKYYIIYGPTGTKTGQEESETYLHTLMQEGPGPDVIVRQLTRYISTIPQEIQNQGGYRFAKTVIDNWKKTYDAQPPVSKD